MLFKKIIECSDDETRQKLIKIILSKQNKIKNEGFSKHVLNYIEKINFGNNKGCNKFKNNNEFDNNISGGNNNTTNYEHEQFN